VSKRGERKHWTVLLAEDDDQAALLVEIALGKVSSIPVEVHRARNGFEALVMVEDLLPDLSLLDLQMPGPSGQEIHNDTTPRFDEEAAGLAQRRVEAFFNEHLRG
jgi:CheY-like chemotaxis protein